MRKNLYSTFLGKTVATIVAITIVMLLSISEKVNGQTTLWTEGIEGVASGNIGCPSVSPYLINQVQLPTGWANTTSSYWCSSTNYAHAGTKSMTIRYAWNSWLMSPGTALSAGVTYQFSYWYRNADANTGFTMNAGVNTAQSSTGITILGTVNNPVNTTWSQVTYSYTPATSGTYYFGVQNSSGSFTPNYLYVDDISLVRLCTAVITSTTPGSRCGTGTVDLSAVASEGTLNWYDASTGGNLVGTGSPLTTPSISVTTTYYVDATSTCTTPSRTAVVATVSGIPVQPSAITGSATPGAGSTQTYSVTNVAGVTYTWSFPSDWTQTAGGTTNNVTVTVGNASGNVSVTPSNLCGTGTAQTLAVTTSLTTGYIANGSWICPPGITSVTVECTGGGGAGGGATGNPAAGGGGAGGSYVSGIISVTPGTSYTVNVGAVKTATTTSTAVQNVGNPSWFGSTSLIYANGGNGGAPATSNSTNGAPGLGSTTACAGTTINAGGSATTGSYTSGTPGGAGGGAAGSAGVGNDAIAGVGGLAKLTNGGAGASGVANSTAGATGGNYGGGGSGGKANSSTDRAGGSGAGGYVVITVIPTTPLITPTALASFGNVCVNTTVGPNSFTINGSNLTSDDITVGALSGYTYSTTSGGTYTTTLTLTQPGGTYSQIIYVIFNPTLVQSYNGNIPITGGGAPSVIAAASGSGVNSSPSITSPTSTAVLSTTATLGGNITSIGCSDVIERGIYWSTTTGFLDGDGTKVSETPGPYTAGVFTIPVSGLASSTVYYYKAFATNSGGTVYTTQGTFTTSCGAYSIPYFEGFESLTTAGTLPVCMAASPTISAGGKTQTYIASATGTNSALIARTGSKFSAVYWNPSATSGYFFSAPIQLTGGQLYLASIYYKTDGVAWTDATLYYGTSATTGAMTNTIVTVANAGSTSYSQINGTFTPATTGVYYVAFRGYNSSATPNYIAFDDFLVDIVPAPAITSLSLTSGCPGSSLVINGTGLGGATSVTIGGTTATITANTAISITVTVGSGTTGTVSVTTPAGTATSTETYTILPVPTAVPSSVSPLCAGANINLTGGTDIGTSFNWSGPNGFTSTSQNPTITSVSVAASGTYSFTATASGCSATATTSVVINPTPSEVSVNPSSASVCEESIQSLVASGGTIIASGTGIVGSGSGTATVYDNPFYSNWSHTQQQILVKASELTTAGIPAGNITSLAMTINSGTTIMPDFSLSIAPTSITAMSTMVTSGYTLVYSNLTGLTPVVGTNTITFSTPFAWDGTSNIILKFCWGNSGSIATISSTAVANTTTYVCSLNAHNVAATSGSSICSNTTVYGSYSNRPKFTFGYSSLTPTTLTWTPTTDLYTDATATTPYNGGAATTVYTKPTSGITYTATATSGSGCSNSGISAITLIAIPDAPTLSVVDNCGNSTITAANYTGILTWSDAGTGNPRIVTAGTYTVTQSIDGCPSEASNSVIAAPMPLPGTPTLSVTDNCGNSTITASNYTGTLTWSDAGTGNPRTVTSGTLTVTQTIDGCTSLASNSVTATPIAIPDAPTLAVTNNCGNSTITASNYTGTLSWSDAGTGNPRTETSGTFTVTQTIDGCPSAASNSVTAAPITLPDAPTLAVTNNCGNSTITASNYTGTLTWSDAGTGNPRTVTSGTITVTQTIDGCPSAASNSVTAEPIAIPDAPTLSVTDNCGNSTITASNYTGTLTWSDAGTGNPRTVTSGTYTVTQTVNGCTSVASNSVTAEPIAIPGTPTVSVVNNCGNSVLTATDYTGSLTWSTTETTPSIMVTTGGPYGVIQTENGCTSNIGVGIAYPKVIPDAPVLSVTDNCGNSTITASNYTGSLTWSDAGTGNPRTETSGTFTVIQTIDGCPSAASNSVTAAPIAIPDAPILSVVNNCGNSTITAINYTGTLTWSDAGTGNPRTVTSGTFTVTQTIDGCTSVASNSVTAAPKVIPTVSLGSDITLCADQTLMLDAGNAGGSYAWTPSGETSQTITVGVPGYVIGPNPISVSVTAPNLCSASSSVLITFDACTGIVENNTAVNMSIYPNPTTGKLTLTISGVNENVKLYIVTTNGQVIYADEFYAIYNGTSHQIDMSAFPKGIYFIKLANDNTVNVKKVVVY